MQSKFFEQSASILQRAVRSYNRFKLHEKIYKTEPLVGYPTLTLDTNYKILEGRINTIIDELSKQKVVLDDKNCFHYTTISNLKSILKLNYIYGAKTLNNLNIPFVKNALGDADITRGDADVICCAPNLVDKNAFMYFQRIKNDSCRLTLHIGSEKISNYSSNCNQFFKLIDLGLDCFNGSFKITNDLTLNIATDFQGSNFKIEFRGYSLTIDTSNLPFYYGNVENINRFALLKLFEFIEGSKNLYGYELIITDEEKFARLMSLPNPLTSPILIEKPNDNFQFWGFKDGLWQLSDLDPNEFPELPGDWIRKVFVDITPSDKYFNIFNKSHNQTKLQSEFYAYLTNLSDSALKSLITNFAKSLTCFSEYNFNSRVSMNHVKISEILILGDEKMKIDLSHLSNEDYQTCLTLIKNDDTKLFKENYGIKVSNLETISIENNQLNYFGETMMNSQQLQMGLCSLTRDFTADPMLLDEDKQHSNLTSAPKN